MKNIFFLILMISIELSRYFFNYKVLFYEWKNNIHPWLGLYLIMGNNESRIETSSTGIAYVNFNGEQYADNDYGNKIEIWGFGEKSKVEF